ncbi:MAG TPA: DNA translocase FtsK 4TM domain-containing protein [Acetivibrio sp.]|uniref:FtsK/SpoIIIE family DNA translocase n=1 Tax=Acetivibrio sp. TaxID=1872092 RepID=UPI002BDB1A23|nr:DNA translocase FtsK 4TM domain-containing protein [Acetivibrio sp.]HOM01415.1 DNA translocase FtsK 4TM domain-containing protein [Acetivibrio sp.]
MKAKKAQKKKQTKKKNGIGKYNNEIIGIMMLALGTLALFSLFAEDSIGISGTFVKSVILGLMGWLGYVVPPFIIFYSILVIFKKNSEKAKSKITYIFVLILIMTAMVQTLFYNEKDYINKGTVECIKKFFNDGVAMQGGGVLGGIISIPFLLLFKNLGTIIILTTIALIDIIIITDISIAGVILRVKNDVMAIVSKVENRLRVTNSELKEKMREEDEAEAEAEPDIDIVMNGKKLPKILNFKERKAAKESKSNKAEDSSHSEKPDDTEKAVSKVKEVEPEAEEVDFIVQDLKKNDASESKVEEMAESVNKEISLNTQDNVEYRYPHTGLLDDNKISSGNAENYRSAALKGAKKLEETLKSFGVDAKVVNVSMGPAVTRYELQPSPGVKVSKIVSLSDDISLNLAASGVRIEAPIPGKAAVGIEVPNKEVVPVFLKDVLDSKEFKDYDSKLAFALGKDISGQNVVADIAKMPHLLVAGATGSGKSVCINSLIVSLLFKASPNEVKLLMVDPKVVELGIYNGIPHLLIPVVTDPKKAAGALNWAVQEMVNRYKLFADRGVRDIKGYNALLAKNGETELLPQIVIIIDELADLMMVAPNDVEDAICRLAQMARAAGMHLVIATQRPSVDVITGVIKANIPSRIAFAVSSQVDSRTIIDMAGAEKLLGKGDMLFYPVGAAKPIRVKGAFVSDGEVERVVEYIKSQGNAEYNEDIIEEINSEKESRESDPGDNDELLPQAIELVVDAGQASVSLIQRKFKVGYARAARIVDQMEARGIVGPFEGSKPRQVLITKQQLQEMNMKSAE